jgi:HlyD family secretion protein
LALAANNQVVTDVAETNIAQMRLGQEATIQVDAYPDQTFTGRVTQIAAQSVVEQNVTSFEVKVAVLSNNRQLLRSGMNASVDFKVGQLNNALVVPTVAIARQQSGTGVFVIGSKSRPTFTPITTGVTVDDKTEVRTGLQGNEKVLVSFPEGAKPSPRTPALFPGMQPNRRSRS